MSEEKDKEEIFEEVDGVDIEDLLDEIEDSIPDSEDNTQKHKHNKHKKKHKRGHYKPHKPKRPVPFHIERYPHAHYYKINSPEFDAQKYLYILNDWLKSLTNIYTLLANQSVKGDKKLTEEIIALIDKLKLCRDLLTEYMEKYFEDERNVLNEFLSLTDYIGNTLIPKLDSNLYDLLLCVENRLITHDGFIKNNYNDIQDIFNYIDNIYQIIQNIVSSSGDTSTLTAGTDYTITYYNGWYAETEPSPRVRRTRTVLESPSGLYYTDEITFNETSHYKLYNSSVVNTTTINSGNYPQFAHGSDPVEEVPRSRKWLITFTDNNYKTPVSTEQYGNNVCNVLPRSAKASWPVACSLNTEQGSGKLLCYMGSIGDGWNQQYSNYVTNGDASELNFLSNTNCNMRATYVYSVT